MKNTILLIDDDQDFVEATSLLLQSEGYEVLSASNGQEGFQKAKDNSPDIILLDMMMTYKTEGAEMAKALAGDAATRAIPLVLITGAKQEMGFPFELKPNQQELPVKTIMEKPVQPERLLSTIKIFLKRSGEEHRHLVHDIESLVDKWKDKQGNIIMILHEIQNHYGYVPREVSFELSRLLNIPLARIYEVVTFYNYFKLNPPGKHLISICMGTACYLKGTPQLLAELKNLLDVEEGQTTRDGLFHLQVVRCLGCCGLAPVLMINGKIYGKVQKNQVADILARYSRESE
ncbi:MAG: NAD(P)H-dependent oxidoreductase subunit E [Candidatus Omnitrophota bacterium]